MAATTDERSARVVEAAASVGATAAILVSPEAVCYASGFHAPVDLGPSPHAGGPDAAILTSACEITLVVEELHEEPARLARATEVVIVPGFAPRPAREPLSRSYATSVLEALRRLDPGPVVAVEIGVLP